MFRHRCILAVLALLLVPSTTGLAQTADARSDVVPPLVGHWVLRVPEPEARIDRAVEEGTQDLGFVIREIARSRLGDAIDAEHDVRVELDGDAVVVTLGAWGPHRLPLDGRLVRADAEDGTRIRARALVAHGSLVVEQRIEEGVRSLYLERRGEGLALSARIHAERLPDEIVYRLAYDRTSQTRDRADHEH